MIESAIYWTGVITIFCILFALIVFSIFIGVTLLRSMIVNELGSLYNHVKLRHLMSKMKELGIDGALKDQQEKTKKEV